MRPLQPIHYLSAARCALSIGAACATAATGRACNPSASEPLATSQRPTSCGVCNVCLSMRNLPMITLLAKLGPCFPIAAMRTKLCSAECVGRDCGITMVWTRKPLTRARSQSYVMRLVFCRVESRYQGEGANISSQGETKEGTAMQINDAKRRDPL